MSEENQEQSATPNSPSLQKTETIATLRQTVQQLERIIVALEAQTTETLPAIAALDTLTASLEEVSTAIETVTGAPLPEIPAETSAVLTPTPPLEEPVELGWLDRILPSFDRLQAGWDWVLARVRNFLPASLSAKLSDWAITSILTGVVVIFLFAAVLVSPGPPASSTIAQTPPSLPPLEGPAPQPSPSEFPETPAAEVEKPLPPPSSEVPVEPEEIIESEIEAPEELEAPTEPEAIVVEEPPPPPLTPEQTLLASIQNRVAEITSQYADGLIRSIEADFLGSQLTVMLEERWYDLEPARQDRVANDVRARSRELDFSKLKLLDLDGNLLARTPIVGEGMVVIRRTNQSTATSWGDGETGN